MNSLKTTVNKANAMDFISNIAAENKPKLEINIALIPDKSLAKQQATISHDLAGRIRTHVELDSSGDALSVWPHLTLYQAAIPINQFIRVHEHIVSIAQTEAPCELEATEYSLNTDGAFEIRYKTTPSLVALQEAIITRINPLREGLLLNKDPGGNKMTALALQDENIAKTGFAEIGDKFRPHSTLAWKHVDEQRDIRIETLPSPAQLNGTFSAIGIFVLGDHGKCVQLLGNMAILVKN